MPGKVKVKIIAGKNLPVMDRSSDTTDAYVEVKLGSTTYKTDVCRKSLNPQWNSDWYRFEVDDSELQDEPLQVRVMDHDTYSANDAIGKVYLGLNPLLLPAGSLLPKLGGGEPVNSSEHVANSVMSGWIPVFDTMHGIRGEINIIVKVELFSDFNKFRQSSCGVPFFCSPVVPHGYHIQMFHGFVEELIVNDDPEYQWIDKIRTPRASNEARQTLFFKLSGELQRKIGLKALELGGNAVVGYSQCFDLEGESGVVVRGIGTAVTLMKLRNASVITNVDGGIEDGLGSSSSSMPVNSELDKGSNNMHASLAHSLRTNGPPAPETIRIDQGHQRTESFGAKISQSPARFHPIPYMHRRSSDSDLSITPKGNSLTGSDKSYGMPSGYFSRVGALIRPLPQDNFDMLEYPFLTLTKYPPGFIVYLGGVVSARSVKLLERISNPEEPESRDTWWSELRMEIRSHARSIGCNAVLAYTETSTICDDVCVLSASGTAAVAGYQYTDVMASSLDRNDFEREKSQKVDVNLLSNVVVNTKPLLESPENENAPSFVNMSPCSLCHLPYAGNSAPLQTSIFKCTMCRSGKVPDILLTTVEMPEGIPSIGRGCFIQAHVCRQLKDVRNEIGAKDISDGLPFLEYELHRILVNKIKIKGMNALFGLKVKISIGIKMLVGIATGTGVYLLPLPQPTLPKLVCDRSTNEKKLAEMQKLLLDTVKMNREIYQLRLCDEITGGRVSPDNESSDDDQTVLDISGEIRDCCVLEVDDPEDMEIMNFLVEPRPPDGFHVVNTELVPGLDELEIVKNLQMFTQIWRAKFHPSFNLGKHIHRLLQSVYFKLRRMIPCAICDLQFRVDLPEAEEIQISILGMALGLGVSQNTVKSKRKNMHISLKDTSKKNDDDMIFNLEDVVESNIDSNFLNVQTTKFRSKSPQRNKAYFAKHATCRDKQGVDITPLSYVPGGKIERYLGNLNFFFIRETTSIREEGGLSGFIHSFVTEVLAMVRAHVAALGGNAMVAYYMTKCVLSHSVHKNQGQCLINVGGDVVFVSYFAEE